MNRTAARKSTPKKKAIRPKRSVTPLAKRPRGAPTQAKDRQRDFIEDLMVASAQALGLTIEPAWRDSVRFHLRLVLDHAARVDAFDLPDDAEPAPLFHA
jgi:hypothetical protein